MGASASLAKGGTSPQTGDITIPRNTTGYKHGGTGTGTLLPQQAGSLTVGGVVDQQHEYMRALNTIQRQQDELVELANQLQRRDEELRLVRDLRTRDGPATPDESLRLRDLRIRQLEEAAAKARSEATKQKSRYKKKSRELVGQLAELRQSTTIRIMELRQEVHKLNQENKQLKERLGLSETALVSVTSPRPPAAGQTRAADDAAGTSNDNRSLIVELSTQLSDQAEELRRLRVQLRHSEEARSRLAQQLPREPPVEAPSASSSTIKADATQAKRPPPLLTSELSFVSQASTNDDVNVDDDESSRLHLPGGDMDSVYSDDTLLYVEMQHQQQHQYQLSSASAASASASSAAGAPGGRSAGIIFDSYKQRTIDKLLQGE